MSAMSLLQLSRSSVSSSVFLRKFVVRMPQHLRSTEDTFERSMAQKKTTTAQYGMSPYLIGLGDSRVISFWLSSRFERMLVGSCTRVFLQRNVVHLQEATIPSQTTTYSRTVLSGLPGSKGGHQQVCACSIEPSRDRSACALQPTVCPGSDNTVPFPVWFDPPILRTTVAQV